MTNYSRGRAFEYRVRDDMQARGYVTVRSPGSHTPVDVYCVKPGEVVFVQCKTSGRMDPAEWNAFLDLCEYAGAVPVLAEREGRKLVYRRITGRKDGGGKQPYEDWEP